MKFQWQAMDASGVTRHGTLSAASSKEARDTLRAQGLYPLTLREKKSVSWFTPPTKSARLRLSGNELALFTRQLATLASASLPLEEALAVIGRQNQNSKLNHILTDLREHILAGHTLSDALAAWPRIFDTIYRTLVKAGEKSGQLGTVLEKLADYNELRQKMRSKLIQALVYPTMLTSVAVIVVTILLTTVVPKVVEQFLHMKQQLPLSTRALLTISDALREFGPFLLAALVVALLLFRHWLTRPGKRHQFDRWLLAFRLSRGLLRAVHCARYLHTLSILHTSGVPLLEGMGLAAEGINNREIQARLRDAADRVRQGSGFHLALDKCDLFPPMMLYMIASGEKSGQLSELMARAAEQQETLLQNRIALALALFEPGLIITMAMIVLFIIVSVLQPILQLNSLVT